MTDRALAFCAFPPGSRLLDLGCGAGATVEHVRRRYSLDIAGIDRDPAFADEARGILRGDASLLPFPSGSMDGILMECSLSVMEDRELALDECGRVLKPRGKLVLSDLYARGEPASFGGCLGRVARKEEILAALARRGFEAELFEDRSEELLSLWASIVFERGAEAFREEAGAGPDALKAAKCGYFLLVASRPSA